MSTVNLIRWSGVASLLAGVLHVLGALLHPVQRLDHTRPYIAALVGLVIAPWDLAFHGGRVANRPQLIAYDCHQRSRITGSQSGMDGLRALVGKTRTRILRQILIYGGVI